jgi:hypothetical protein
MSVYIYTLPKAGTYFLAELLDGLGLNNTGYHMTRDAYLDTKKFSIDENAKTPAKATVMEHFASVIGRLQSNDVVFGHFPLPLNISVVPDDMKIICSYRHPVKTLVSEFIDFRFRREDIDWLSKKTIPNDQDAFAHFMKEHGIMAHLPILRRIVFYKHLVNHPLTPPLHKSRALFVNFDHVLRDYRHTKHIAHFLGFDLSEDEAKELHKKTLSSETKTKAVDLKINRSALWNDDSRATYANSGFPQSIVMGRIEGLDL